MYAAHADAKVLAGGQSLIPLLSMRLAAPAVLVDLGGLDELAYVRADDAGVRVGALARHADVARDPDARRVQPLVAEALHYVAHATIRNRGTTVGSIVHADAAAEMPAVLCLLGGHVAARSVHGTREIAAAELFVGPLETSLEHGEIVTEAFFPALARAPASASTRSPAATATTPWSVRPPSSRSATTGGCTTRASGSCRSVTSRWCST